MPILTTTPRAALQDAAGVCTHLNYTGKTNYADPAVDAAIVQLGVGWIRFRWAPDNKAMVARLVALAEHGIRFHMFVGELGDRPDEVVDLIDALAASPLAPHAGMITGPNEPNATGRADWPAQLAEHQRAILEGRNENPELAAWGVCGPGLKWAVRDVDGDFQKAHDAGVNRWCEYGEFHRYPGKAGPVINHDAALQAQQLYDSLPLIHGETGWTEADTSQDISGPFTVESILRNHHDPLITRTLLYELFDEAPIIPGREGLFGLARLEGPKRAYLQLQQLLAAPDGNEPFDGRLRNADDGTQSDAGVVVTSEGAGAFTLWLTRNSQTTANIGVPAAMTLDLGTDVSDEGARRRHYAVPLTDSLTVVHATTQP